MMLCRLLLPIARKGRYWEALLLTPRFMIHSPAWLGATTYLAALTCSCLVGLTALLVVQLRSVLRGQSYLESLQVDTGLGRPVHDGQMPPTGLLLALLSVLDKPTPAICCRSYFMCHTAG